jgi:hypothetical protein
MEKPTIVVWFSCGAASAVAAKKTLELYGNTHLVRVVNTPVLEEDVDNLRFKDDVAKWLGVEIETATSGAFPDNSCKSVWAYYKYMSGPEGAVCTKELKKGARYEFEKNTIDFHVLGFTFDERDRHKRFILTERDNVIPVLIDLKITKQDCFNELLKAGISLPRIYYKGFPNANCIGCVKSTSPTYWNLVRREYPEVFNDRATQSKELGVRLVKYKGNRVFLSDLPENARGYKLETYNLDCGIFCEEGV